MGRVILNVLLLIAIFFVCNISCRRRRKLSVAQKACLDQHNRYRAFHGKTPLKWDSKLAAGATKWAMMLARKNSFKHSKGNYGENIAFASNSRGVSNKGKEAVVRWYKEICKYSKSSCRFSSGTGHFTQVIWNGSKKLGCGVITDGNKVYTVARYYPKGNMRNKFKINVGCGNARSVLRNKAKTCGSGRRGK